MPTIEDVLDGVKGVQDLIEDEKEHLQNGLYVRLCDAMQKVYNHAHALKKAENGNSDDELMSDEDEETGEGSESDEEPRERTEDDMELNELAELWEWNFDFGRPNAVLPLEGLIEFITMGDEVKRVCAAVRVLNRALSGSKPDDPADAERILEWKEELAAERAIRVCAEILERVDERGFHNEAHEEHCIHFVLCDEILELFQRLGEGDALFRTKMRRNGALKGVEDYAREHPTDSNAQDVLEMLRQR